MNVFTCTINGSGRTVNERLRLAWAVMFRRHDPDDVPGAPLHLDHDGHRTRIKWHRARRRPDDPPFTARRIIEAMRLGASVEVDLVLHADRGYAVLHDRTVDRATTGVGRVADLSAAQLREISLRSNRGRPLYQRVLLLEDLASLLADVEVAPDALLQLDFKEDAAALDDVAVEVFATAVAPFARNAILSCGDAEAVRILTDAAPGIRIGYDPCHHGAADAAKRSRDFDAFVRAAVTASPRAEMVYLENRLILDADRLAFDIIGAFHDAGRLVDGYTVNRVDRKSIPMIRRLIDLRVDQITTDDAEALAALG